MSTTCKSPRKVAQVALEVGTDALKPYSHQFSPQKFTQPQLFACLVLKQFYKTDYRGIAAILADNSDLRQTAGQGRQSLSSHDIQAIPEVRHRLRL